MAKRIRGTRRKTVWAVLFAAAVILLCAAACAEGTQCVDSDGIINEEHNWIVSVVTPPTCQTDGNTLYYCTQCGNYYTGDVIPAGEQYHSWYCIDDGPDTHHRECSYCGDKKASEPHNWSAWYTSSEAFAAKYGMVFPGGQLKAPTCTEDGIQGRYCPDCGYTQTAKVAAGHKPVEDPAVEPTCEKPGKTAGSHCAVCGAVITAQKEISATGHKPVEDPAVEPACEKPGKTAGSHCAVCGKVIDEQKEVPATGHKPVEDPAVEPTCEKPGKTAGSHCAVCGKVIDEQKEIPTTGHKPVEDPAVEPTCEKPGKTAGSHCSVCGKVIDEQKEIPATGHKPVEDPAVEPTCEKPGKTAGSHCSICGAVIDEQKEIPATGHKPVEDPAVAATCEKPGKTAGSHCAVCGKVIDEQKEIPAAGHQFVKDPAVEPTCEKPGKTAGSHCYICGAAIPAQQEIPATGHKPVEDPAVEPTCEKPGKTAGSHCSVCGKVIDEQKEVPATGHRDVDDPAVEPTCEQPGRTAGSHCSICGAVTGEQKEIPATGHKPVEDPAVEPTCENPGKTAGSHCAVCGAVIDEQKEVPATGHSYSEPAWTWSGKTAVAKFTCGSCGHLMYVGASVSENKEADGVRLRATASLDGKSYENELFLTDEEYGEAEAPGDSDISDVKAEKESIEQGGMLTVSVRADELDDAVAEQADDAVAEPADDEYKKIKEQMEDATKVYVNVGDIRAVTVNNKAGESDADIDLNTISKTRKPVEIVFPPLLNAGANINKLQFMRDHRNKSARFENELFKTVYSGSEFENNRRYTTSWPEVQLKTINKIINTHF